MRIAAFSSRRWFLPCSMILILFALATLLGTVSDEAAVSDDFKALRMTQFDEDTEAPDLTLTTTSGEVLRLSDLQGKVVLLNFWATW